jgi:hypothetical protein
MECYYCLKSGGRSLYVAAATEQRMKKRSNKSEVRIVIVRLSENLLIQTDLAEIAEEPWQVKLGRGASYRARFVCLEQSREWS